ncbi:MAG: hypothetical protein HOP18_09920 [Deltaproteobacteria bacterium]|nr:hypothetical protein [Deltaproteobacteria bacterium]
MEAVGRMMRLVLVMGLMVMGCGSDGGNDNGVSFRAVGIFQGELDQDKCTVPNGEDATITDQSIDISLDSSALSNGYPTGIFFCRGYIWLENLLNGQAIVIDRLDFEYEIPGARISLPSHSSSMVARINPADSEAPTPFAAPNIYIGQPDAQMIPASVVLFLRQNRQVLPALPYPLIVHITARGRTDAGQRVTTNAIRYTVQFTPS